MFRIVTSVEIYLVAVFFDCFFHNNTENTFGILKEGKCKETDNLINMTWSVIPHYVFSRIFKSFVNISTSKGGSNPAGPSLT